MTRVQGDMQEGDRVCHGEPTQSKQASRRGQPLSPPGALARQLYPPVLLGIQLALDK